MFQERKSLGALHLFAKPEGALRLRRARHIPEQLGRALTGPPFLTGQPIHLLATQIGLRGHECRALAHLQDVAPLGGYLQQRFGRLPICLLQEEQIHPKV